MTARDRSARATPGTESDDDAQPGTTGGDDASDERPAERTADDGGTDDDGTGDDAAEASADDGAADGGTAEASADDGATDGGADDATDEADEQNGDDGRDSVPEVSLTLYQLTVSVTGQASDDLTDVEESAMRLMDYLVEKSGDLEDHPDDRGLG
jgi:hypothetical protein